MKIKNVLTVLSIAFIGGFSALGVNWIFTEFNKQAINLEPKQTPYSFTNYNKTNVDFDFTAAAEQTINGVVHVKTKMHQSNRQPNIYDFFFGNPHNGGGNMPVLASGSGVIISKDGYIVTNNHVIDKANNIEVVLNDKRSFKAELVGRDPSTDIALLKIDAKNLPVISFGNSEKLKLGEWVLAVGNPFNLTSTVTAGIVSAKGRNLNILQKSYAIESFIQTDAAVNPGNSGGALVNVKGELVGINTAIASQTGSYSGYSFAVPVSIVKKVVADLTEFGIVQRALLGVSIRDIDAEFAKEIGTENLEGVYINTVSGGSAADEAGIKANDIIVKLNDIKINKVARLQEQISKYRPGDKITVHVRRNDKITKFLVTLKNNIGTTSYINKSVINILGASFGEITEDEKRKLGIKHGVKVEELSAGKLLAAGVKEGFIITHINRNPVTNTEEIQNIINQIQGGVYVKGIYPNGATAYYAFGIE